jgi:putative salt-induced outer membrane protein
MVSRSQQPHPEIEIMNSICIRSASVLAALSMASFAAMSQDKPDGQWHGGISLGGAASSGNTSSRTLSATADMARATAADKISLYSAAVYGRTGSTTTADLFRLGGRYDWNLSPQLFAFGGAETETNKAGGVKSRFGLNGGLGYKLVRTPTTAWDVFAGVGYTDTKFTDNTTRNGATLVLGEESSHKLSDTTTAKQRLVIYPGNSEVGTSATFDAGLATAIAGGWTLNTGLSVRHAGKVAVGLKKTDSLVTVGFGYKF